MRASRIAIFLIAGPANATLAQQQTDCILTGAQPPAVDPERKQGPRPEARGRQNDIGEFEQFARFGTLRQ